MCSVSQHQSVRGMPWQCAPTLLMPLWLFFLGFRSTVMTALARASADASCIWVFSSPGGRTHRLH